MYLAHAELAIVGVKDPIPADFVLQRQCFRLELDPVGSRDFGPHVHLSGLLLVRMAKLKNNFRIAHGKAVNVRNTPAQDEPVVVEAEVGCIAESDLAYFRPEVSMRIGNEPHPDLLRSLLHNLAE